MSEAAERLQGAIRVALGKGIEKVDEDGGDLLRRAAKRVGNYLEEHEDDAGVRSLALQGVAKIEAKADRIADAAAGELRELLTQGFKALDADYLEGLRELSYQERRKLFRQITKEEAKAAKARAERLAFLAELLEDLGEVALQLLPLLIAAL